MLSVYRDNNKFIPGKKLTINNESIENIYNILLNKVNKIDARCIIVLLKTNYKYNYINYILITLKYNIDIYDYINYISSLNYKILYEYIEEICLFNKENLSMFMSDMAIRNVKAFNLNFESKSELYIYLHNKYLTTEDKIKDGTILFFDKNRMIVNSREYFGNNITNFNLFVTQYDSVNFLLHVHNTSMNNRNLFQGALLADEMGLGKTRQMVAFLEILKEDFVLIVCVKSTLYGWFEECLNTAKSYNILTIVSGKFCNVTLQNKEGVNIIDVKPMNVGCYMSRKSILIINYDIITCNSIKLIKYNTNNVEILWNTIVLDEAHTIRNNVIKKFDIIQNISQPSFNGVRMGNRYAISGTPVENSINDLASIFEFIDCRVKDFVKTEHGIDFLIKNNLFRRTRENISNMLKITMNYPIIAPTINKVIITLPKTNLSNILERTPYQNILYELNNNPSHINNIIYDERSFYILLSCQIQNEEESKGVEIKKASMLRVSMSSIYKNPIYINGQNYSYKGNSTKINKVVEIIGNNCGKSFVIFHRFIDISEKLLSILPIHFPNYNFFAINGSVNIKDRVKILNEIKILVSKGKSVILLSSTQSTNEGVNYQFLSRMIIVDPEYNPKVTDQTISRLDRIGQKNKVIVYRLYMDNFLTPYGYMDIDDKIENISSIKDSLSEIITGNAANTFKRLYTKNLSGDYVSDISFGKDFESGKFQYPFRPNVVGDETLSNVRW